MKVIIAGSRTFNDYSLLSKLSDHMLSKQNHDNITIISGGANGADRLGEKYAIDRGYKLMIMNADWDKFGKSAGYVRNTNMADIADALIAFWDGKSRGTKHMIDIAKSRKLKIKIYIYGQ